MLDRPPYILPSQIDTRLLPSQLDTRDPDFPDKWEAWMFQARCEIKELVVLTRKTLEESRALLAQADHVLGRK